MKRSLIVAVAFIGLAEKPTQAQPGNFDAKHPPRFEDFSVSESWNPPSAPLKLTTHCEQMFKTRLTKAAKEADESGKGSTEFCGTLQGCDLGMRVGVHLWCNH